MKPEADPSDATVAAASRLCAACGMCCNGVMFRTVQLQPRDSAKALSALGMKLKKKRGHQFILQPCPALQSDLRCSIYQARPERCRLFECQQLKRLAAGEITEPMALEKIQTVRSLVDQVNRLLEQQGKTNLKHSLTKRVETALSEPLDPSADPTSESVVLRTQLLQAKQALDVLLNADFRIVPDIPSELSTPDSRLPTPDS